MTWREGASEGKLVEAVLGLSTRLNLTVVSELICTCLIVARLDFICKLQQVKQYIAYFSTTHYTMRQQ